MSDTIAAIATGNVLSAIGILRLSGLKYWSMPASDIDGAAKACWTQTVKTLKKGLVLKCKHSANGKLTVENNLPKASENLIAHVRPHASQAAYLFGEIAMSCQMDAE